MRYLFLNVRTKTLSDGLVSKKKLGMCITSWMTCIHTIIGIFCIEDFTKSQGFLFCTIMSSIDTLVCTWEYYIKSECCCSWARCSRRRCRITAIRVIGRDYHVGIFLIRLLCRFTLTTRTRAHFQYRIGTVIDRKCVEITAVYTISLIDWTECTFIVTGNT